MSEAPAKPSVYPAIDHAGRRKTECFVAACFFCRRPAALQKALQKSGLAEKGLAKSGLAEKGVTMPLRSCGGTGRTDGERGPGTALRARPENVKTGD